MAVVRAETLAVVCVPGANVLILCSRENKIAIAVVSREESVYASACVFREAEPYLIWVSARS